jgi:hypothetical protein
MLKNFFKKNHNSKLDKKSIFIYIKSIKMTLLSLIASIVTVCYITGCGGGGTITEDGEEFKIGEKSPTGITYQDPVKLAGPDIDNNGIEDEVDADIKKFVTKNKQNDTAETLKLKEEFLKSEAIYARFILSMPNSELPKTVAEAETILLSKQYQDNRCFLFKLDNSYVEEFATFAFAMSYHRSEQIVRVRQVNNLISTLMNTTEAFYKQRDCSKL